MRRYEFRYYNGQAWTGDVSTQGLRLIDPLAAAVVVPNATAVPRAPAPARNGLAIAAMVLGAASVVVGWVPFLCFIAGLAALLAIIFGVIGLRRSGRLNGAGKGFAIAGLLLGPLGCASAGVGVWLTVVSVREFTQFVDVGDYRVSKEQCAVDNGVVTYDGDITNLSAHSQSYHLTLRFARPGTDNTLYTAATDVLDVAPDGTAHWSVAHLVEQTELACSVFSVTGPLPFDS